MSEELSPAVKLGMLMILMAGVVGVFFRGVTLFHYMMERVGKVGAFRDVAKLDILDISMYAVVLLFVIYPKWKQRRKLRESVEKER